jgi:hypothetical protein
MVRWQIPIRSQLFLEPRARAERSRDEERTVLTHETTHRAKDAVDVGDVLEGLEQADGGKLPSVALALGELLHGAGAHGEACLRQFLNGSSVIFDREG